MAHGYEVIDYTIIWKIVRVHIPELEITMKEIKNDIHG